MIKIDRMLHERFKLAGKDTYRRFLCSEVIRNWDKLFDESITAQVKPVTIERDILFVNISNTAFKDQLKFYSDEIIDTINKTFGEEEPLIKELRHAKIFQISNRPPKQSEPAQTEKPKVPMETITLTDEEIKYYEERAAKISDDKLRRSALEMALSYARAEKFKLANGWHKCARCDTLCEPEELFCKSCKIIVRQKMFNKLRNILCTAPQLKTHEAQKILLERMPYMSDECLPETVEYIRLSLIQECVSKIRFGEEDPSDVLKLVALEKRLPFNELTPAIIKRTLLDMQSKLLDGSSFQRNDVLNS